MSARREPIGLSRARVCAEALALVDEEGLEALTMRRLAARLDCEAMSLYRHVKDKADLLDALHAAVLGALEPEGALDHTKPRATARACPSGASLLGGLARALRSALLRHPNVLPLFTTRAGQRARSGRDLARVQGAFAAARFTGADAERAIYVVGMFTIGHAIFEKSLAQRRHLPLRPRGAARRHRARPSPITETLMKSTAASRSAPARRAAAGAHVGRSLRLPRRLPRALRRSVHAAHARRPAAGLRLPIPTPCAR